MGDTRKNRPHPKQTCPTCGAKVAITRQGTMFSHRDMSWDKSYKKRSPCKGYGRLSVEAKSHNIRMSLKEVTNAKR